MKFESVRKLRSGDEVTWNDPDGGYCSKTVTISSIEIKGHTVCITDTNGGYLECFPKELS